MTESMAFKVMYCLLRVVHLISDTDTDTSTYYRSKNKEEAITQRLPLLWDPYHGTAIISMGNNILPTFCVKRCVGLTFSHQLRFPGACGARSPGACGEMEDAEVLVQFRRLVNHRDQEALHFQQLFRDGVLDNDAFVDMARSILADRAQAGWPEVKFQPAPTSEQAPPTQSLTAPEQTTRPAPLGKDKETWGELSAREQAAARLLGYSEAAWEEGDPLEPAGRPYSAAAVSLR